MILASHNIRSCRQRLKNILCGLVIFCLAMVGDAQTAEIVVTNTPLHWMSLDALLKKWEGTSLDNVKQAAEKGDLTAQHYLGYCYTEGFRAVTNPAAGVAWYRRALESGYTPSANNLGLVYQRGLAGTNDMAKAVYYYRYAADRGLAQAQANLGILYCDGNGVERNFIEAMKWFRRAADQGHTTAMVEIGN